jgi:hypothetical protein
MHHVLYVLVTLAIGFGLGRIHNGAKVRAQIAAAVAAAQGAVKK